MIYMKFQATGAIPNFIKGLMSEINIPIVEIWKEGNIVLEGCVYIYRDRIIKAMQTGEPNSLTDTYLDERGNRFPYFDIVGDYIDGKAYHGITIKYLSKETEWSRTDHYYLGMLCRYYRDLLGIDLMPAYNCWDGGEMYDVGLHTKIDNLGKTLVYSGAQNEGMRTLTVPIRPFNDYTILLECPTEVLITAGFTKDGRYMTQKTAIPDGQGGYQDYTLSQGYRFERMNILNPVKIRIDDNELKNTNYYKMSEFLTLLIQVPREIQRVYVIEGDYSTEVERYEYGAEATEYKRSKVNISAMNVLTPYLACIDRLVEYLSGHPITDGQFSQSITNVQKIISSDAFKKITGGTFYRKAYTEGIWDKDIQRFIKTIFDKPFNGHPMVPEQVGDVVKEIEQYIEEVNNV